MSLNSAERRRAVRDALRVWFAYTPNTRLAALASESPGAAELTVQLVTTTKELRARIPRPPPSLPQSRDASPNSKTPTPPQSSGPARADSSGERTPTPQASGGGGNDVEQDGAEEKDGDNAPGLDEDDEKYPEVYAIREQLGLGPILPAEYLALYQQKFHVLSNGTRRNARTTRSNGLANLVRGFDAGDCKDTNAVQKYWTNATKNAFPYDEPISGTALTFKPSTTQLTNKDVGQWYITAIQDSVRDADSVDARALAMHLVNCARLIESHDAWSRLPTQGRGYTRSRVVKLMYTKRGIYCDDFTGLNDHAALTLLADEKYKKTLGNFQSRHKDLVRGRTNFYELYKTVGPQVFVDRQWTPATLTKERKAFFDLLDEITDYPSLRRGFTTHIDGNCSVNTAAVLGIAYALDADVGRLLKEFFKRFPSRPGEAEIAFQADKKKRRAARVRANNPRDETDSE